MSSLHTLKLMGQWAIALTVSRILQAILTIAALAVDGAVISAWNADQYKFNSYFSEGAKANWSLDTTVGGTPFTGVVIAASLLTLAAIIYDQAFQRVADIFWDLYGVLVLELMVAIFWVASFAGMASYVGEMSFPVSIVSAFAAEFSAGGDSTNGVAGNTVDLLNHCVAIAVLGALIFGLALSNILIIIAYVVRDARVDRRKSRESGTVVRENHDILPPGIFTTNYHSATSTHEPSGGPGPVDV